MTREEFNRVVDLLQTLCREAIYYFEEVRKEDSWKGRKGGYFCVADSKTGAPLHAPVLIGEVPLEKAAKYLQFCAEKALRLASHTGHVSSWQTRDPLTEKWGGAVLVGDLIFSFSGVPELGDEVLMLIIASVYYREIRRAAMRIIEEDIRGIVNHSNNLPYHQLRGFLATM